MIHSTKDENGVNSDIAIDERQLLQTLVAIESHHSLDLTKSLSGQRQGIPSHIRVRITLQKGMQFSNTLPNRAMVGASNNAPRGFQYHHYYVVNKEKDTSIVLLTKINSDKQVHIQQRFGQYVLTQYSSLDHQSLTTVPNLNLLLTNIITILVDNSFRSLIGQLVSSY